jgi:hypothetical protein
MEERLRFSIQRHEDLNFDTFQTAKFISKNLYNDGTATSVLMQGTVLDKRGINFLSYYDSNLIGFFQSVPLENCETMYFSMGVTDPDYRNNGLYSKGIDLRIKEARKMKLKYCVLRTANPLVVEIYSGMGFLPQIPEIVSSFYRKIAEDSIGEYKKHHVDVNEFMVSSGRTVSTYGFIPTSQPSSNQEINDFMSKYLDKENGDRLVMIKDLSK